MIAEKYNEVIDWAGVVLLSALMEGLSQFGGEIIDETRKKINPGQKIIPGLMKRCEKEVRNI